MLDADFGTGPGSNLLRMSSLVILPSLPLPAIKATSRLFSSISFFAAGLIIVSASFEAGLVSATGSAFSATGAGLASLANTVPIA